MQNNFNFLRLLFAVFVLITHSHKLSNAKTVDVLHTITQGQTHFSYLGLFGLFSLSGYLVYQSLGRSKSIFIFFRKRILRIFPALLVVLLLTIVLGTFVFEGSVSRYIVLPEMQTYLPNNLFLIKTQYDIPGIFENNPVKRMINGSLWSIQYEAAMYLSLATLFFLSRVWKKWIITIIFLAFLVIKLFFAEKALQFQGNIKGEYYLELAVYFFAGSVLAAFEIEKWKRNQFLIISTSILLVISLMANVFETSRFILLPILVISFGLTYLKPLHHVVQKIGDLSYGVYLYAFPIQQTLMHYFHLQTMALLILSLLISMTFAWLSWHIVEKRAMNWKKEMQRFQT